MEAINHESATNNLIEQYQTNGENIQAVELPFEVKEGEEYFVEQVGLVKRKPFFAFFKRSFDFFVSLIGLIVLFLPFIIIAIAIKCTSKGPVFYKQERLGLNGKKFNLYKFRTMRADAEKDGARWSDGDDDERIHKVGKFLRKTRLDELPQLLNCLVGNMTIVGPRPERECFYVAFEKYIHGFSERLKVKPGITGLAQVNGGYNLKPQEKVVYDVEYIKTRSLWLDIKILFKTVGVIFTHKGAK